MSGSEFTPVFLLSQGDHLLNPMIDSEITSFLVFILIMDSVVASIFKNNIHTCFKNRDNEYVIESRDNLRIHTFFFKSWL